MNNCWLKIMDSDLSERKLHWYDLVKCQIKRKQITQEAYLPAAFLEKKGVLPKLDTRDDHKYSIDFDKLKIENMTIDEYFSKCKDKKSLQKLSISKLFPYCRFLYYAPTGTEDDYGKTVVDQAQRQFRKEYDNFKKSFFKVQDEWAVSALENAAILKMFILYRSIKLDQVVDIPLDYNRKSLPDNSKVRALDLDNIFLTMKDIQSVAPLDGRMHSLNEVLIEKLYALLWTNSSISDDECYRICEYLNSINMISTSIFENFFSQDNINDIQKRILPPKENKTNTTIEENEKILNEIGHQLDCTVQQAIYSINSHLIAQKNIFSLYSYAIIKLYTYNKIRFFQWQKRANDVQINIKYPSHQELEEILEIVKTVNIYSFKQFFQLFDKNSSISNEQQLKILKFIFCTNEIHKATKLRSLKAHARKISAFYKHYLYASRTSLIIDYSACYYWIISSYLFFQLKDVELKRKTSEHRTTKIHVNSEFDDRRSTINSLYNHVVDDRNLKTRAAFYYYDVLIGNILPRYYPMYSLRRKLNIELQQRCLEMQQNAFISLLEQGLFEIQRFATIRYRLKEK